MARKETARIRAEKSWAVSSSDALRIPCPMCQRVALVRLPQSLLAFETDGTNVVCHPALGGCNHGFEAPKC